MSSLHPSISQVKMPFDCALVVGWSCFNTDSKVFNGFFIVGTVGLVVLIKFALAAVIVVAPRARKEEKRI